MKFKIKATAAVVLASSLATPVFAAEPCAAVLCLGSDENPPNMCKSAVDDYFNIRVYRDKRLGGHAFDPAKTLAKRIEEVNDKCPDADRQTKDWVNAHYGMMERSPFKF